MYSSLTTALILFASLRTAVSIPHGSPPSTSSPTGPPYLNELAQKHGKLWFGTAADIPGPEQQDEGYMSILNDTKIFGEITPANYMKVNIVFQ
jgi:endo-1,4-beta-xylanase